MTFMSLMVLLFITAIKPKGCMLLKYQEMSVSARQSL